MIEDEKKRIQAQRQGLMSKKLKEKLNVVVRELNSIAGIELGKIGDGSGEGEGEKRPFVPLGGFGFVPTYVYVQTGKRAGITLRALVPEKVDAGSLILVDSDSTELLILTPTVTIRERTDYPGVGECVVEIEGRQVGAEAIVTARADALKAEALVKVIAVKTRPVDPHPPKLKGSLIRGVRFDPTGEPRQRVRFERATSEVVISTQAPSVAEYFDDEGRGHETAQGQVLLAEMITEALCREVARRGVESGKYPTIQGSEADAVQREYINLQNKYAHRVHSCVVDAQFRRLSELEKKKGRPPKPETLARAVIEA